MPAEAADACVVQPFGCVGLVGVIRPVEYFGLFVGVIRPAECFGLVGVIRPVECFGLFVGVIRPAECFGPNAVVLSVCVLARVHTQQDSSAPRFPLHLDFRHDPSSLLPGQTSSYFAECSVRGAHVPTESATAAAHPSSTSSSGTLLGSMMAGRMPSRRIWVCFASLRHVRLMCAPAAVVLLTLCIVCTHVSAQVSAHVSVCAWGS